ncbi:MULTISPECIES: hypothetical protein [unclassified Enterococcus]|uniref:hypothetical protein n=1 Tax=unclassified Enterococcus TaxID=2608891 RepID=UPI00155220B7|nr:MULTISPECIES: hypothetical protein [unclassified Enterococcus]MBS7575931.1 hypothetical protein [Enterococcus sp. MMGLQ5-2]MBS7583164.1 hypothetical protein [Enterococcus sp. MMGLQ5-1]NPD11024.1 hypothetical protein [Enterococcus sp. MMGLQ5-1]NPD35767.1 hypothetical protein [Enterococcus sp. MMGLQ5-2]
MLLDWFKKILKWQDNVIAPLDQGTVESEYLLLEPYVETPLNAREERRVFLIATSIAAGDAPSSQYKIKSIKKENPIYKEVSIITASIVAENAVQSGFKIRSIKVRKE